MDPYDRLVWEVWMPRLRRTLLTWSPKTCSPLIDLLELWMPLLPPWVLDNILDQLVLPRLQREVSEWDPTTDPVPIHNWIHPWLPLMGEYIDYFKVTPRVTWVSEGGGVGITFKFAQCTEPMVNVWCHVIA